MLIFEDGFEFAQGMSTFSLMQGEGNANRIYVLVEIDGVQTRAYLDTGGVWLICHPFVSEQLGLDPNEGEPQKMEIRGHLTDGRLHRMELTLLAEEGKGILLQVTAFIPDDQDFDVVNYPILGYQGCLERIRFAIDPGTTGDAPTNGRFYFGV